MFFCGGVSTWISENILNSTGFVGRASANMVVGELPLDVCVKFWGRRAERTSIREIADILSVTGCVPRYLEEIDPSLSADENIRRMCFAPDAMLRDDFPKIFNAVFGGEAVTKRRPTDTSTPSSPSGGCWDCRGFVPRRPPLVEAVGRGNRPGPISGDASLPGVCKSLLQ